MSSRTSSTWLPRTRTCMAPSPSTLASALVASVRSRWCVIAACPDNSTGPGPRSPRCTGRPSRSHLAPPRRCSPHPWGSEEGGGRWQLGRQFPAPPLGAVLLTWPQMVVLGDEEALRRGDLGQPVPAQQFCDGLRRAAGDHCRAVYPRVECGAAAADLADRAEPVTQARSLCVRLQGEPAAVLVSGIRRRLAGP